MDFKIYFPYWYKSPGTSSPYPSPYADYATLVTFFYNLTLPKQLLNRYVTCDTGH